MPARKTEVEGRDDKPDDTVKTREIGIAVVWSTVAINKGWHTLRDPDCATYNAAIANFAHP